MDALHGSPCRCSSSLCRELVPPAPPSSAQARHAGAASPAVSIAYRCLSSGRSVGAGGASACTFSPSIAPSGSGTPQLLPLLECCRRNPPPLKRLPLVLVWPHLLPLARPMPHTTVAGLRLYMGATSNSRSLLLAQEAEDLADAWQCPGLRCRRWACAALETTVRMRSWRKQSYRDRHGGRSGRA